MKFDDEFRGLLHKNYEATKKFMKKKFTKHCKGGFFWIGMYRRKWQG